MVMVAGAVGVVALLAVVMMVVVLVLVVVVVIVMVMMFILIMVIIVVVMVVMMLVLVLVVMMMVVLMLVMVIIVVVVLMLVLGLLGLVLGTHPLQHFVGQRHLFHGGEDGLAGELIPGGGEDGGVGILLPQQGHGGLQLLLAQLLGTAEDDGAGGLDLVVVKLAEVLHVDLHLGGVGHGDEAVELHVRLVLHGVLHGHDHVAELAHAGGLDEDAVGVELVLHLDEGLVEVTHQGAADAARRHLADLHAGLLQEAAVDGDLTELVFDQHQLFALVGLGQQLFDQSGFARAQEAGHDVDFCHSITFLHFEAIGP